MAPAVDPSLEPELKKARAEGQVDVADEAKPAGAIGDQLAQAVANEQEAGAEGAPTPAKVESVAATVADSAAAAAATVKDATVGAAASAAETVKEYGGAAVAATGAALQSAKDKTAAVVSSAAETTVETVRQAGAAAVIGAEQALESGKNVAAQVANTVMTKTGETMAAAGDKIKESAPEPPAAPADEGGIPGNAGPGVPPGPGGDPLGGAGATTKLGE